MPQTSPMSWSILSLLMVMSIMNMLSLNNEKMNYKTLPKFPFSLTTTSWKW